jgi:hypothetical protein
MGAAHNLWRRRQSCMDNGLEAEKVRRGDTSAPQPYTYRVHLGCGSTRAPPAPPASCPRGTRTPGLRRRPSSLCLLQPTPLPLPPPPREDGCRSSPIAHLPTPTCPNAHGCSTYRPYAPPSRPRQRRAACGARRRSHSRPRALPSYAPRHALCVTPRPP